MTLKQLQLNNVNETKCLRNPTGEEATDQLVIYKHGRETEFERGEHRNTGSASDESGTRTRRHQID